jgi:predicted regulator of Ras-like GTPase activity (Roadblock/LC7/MglB family)
MSKKNIKPVAKILGTGVMTVTNIKGRVEVFTVKGKSLKNLLTDITKFLNK